MVSQTIHMIRSTKTPVRPTLRDQAANTDFDHDAPAMQHIVHVWRAVQTALALQQLALVRLVVPDRNPPPRKTQRTVKTGISIYQPQSTPASGNNHPAALQRLNRPQLPVTIVQLHFNDSTDLSFPQQSSSCILRLNPHQLPATIV